MREAAGRRAEILETISPESVRGGLIGSLDSENEDVQVWATSQLRSQGVPEAIRLLIERLDSPLPAVREAAGQELGSFDLSMVLNLFERLDRAVSPPALSRPDAKNRCQMRGQKLVEELNKQIRAAANARGERRRRLRGFLRDRRRRLVGDASPTPTTITCGVSPPSFSSAFPVRRSSSASTALLQDFKTARTRRGRALVGRNHHLQASRRRS